MALVICHPTIVTTFSDLNPTMGAVLCIALEKVSRSSTLCLYGHPFFHRLTVSWRRMIILFLNRAESRWIFFQDVHGARALGFDDNRTLQVQSSSSPMMLDLEIGMEFQFAICNWFFALSHDCLQHKRSEQT